MKNQKNIKENTIYNMIKSVAAIIFPMISFPYASRMLLVDNLGKVNFANSVVSYFSLIAALGISTYAIRECSKVKNDRKKLDELASQIYTINLWSTAFSYAVLLITLLFARPLYNYRLLIVIQSMSIVLTTVGADWINTVEEDFKYITIRTVLFQLVSLVLLLVFVHKPDDYVIYAIINVISSAGANISNYFYRKRYCTIRFVLHVDWKRHMPKVMMLFSMLIAQSIYVNSDVTILGIVRGDYEVGLYSVSVKIYNIVQALVNAVTYVVIPQLAFAFSRKDYTKVNQLLRYSVNFTVLLGLPCVVGVCMIAGDLINIIAGPEYLEATLSLQILAVALGCSFAAGVLGNLIMLPSGRDKLCMSSSIVSAALNMVLNLIFIPYFGLNAAAVTTMLSQAVGFFIKMPFVEKEINLGPQKSIFAGPILGCMVIVVIALVLSAVIDGLFVRVGAIVLLSVIAYGVIVIVMKNELALDIRDKFFKILKGNVR